ncbi:MAG: hypothetical protein QNJ46_35090 [Leptolyngbyaceae cyanobacterium MO_188.B28]|nr:hypothetical protein [Leptolyngbyaceae cyanobacterium MO_188.B28]
MANGSNSDVFNSDHENELIRPPDLSADGISATAQSSYSTGRWQCVNTLSGHESWVRTLAISADGQILASGSGDKTVRIWSLPTGELRHVLKRPVRKFGALA